MIFKIWLLYMKKTHRKIVVGNQIAQYLYFKDKKCYIFNPLSALAKWRIEMSQQVDLKGQSQMESSKGPLYVVTFRLDMAFNFCIEVVMRFQFECPSKDYSCVTSVLYLFN